MTNNKETKTQNFDIQELAESNRLIQDARDVLPSERFYLSSDLDNEPYWFFYRLDKYDQKSIRASLYHGESSVRGSRKVDDVGVVTNYETRDHFDVINYFEARLSLKEIK